MSSATVNPSESVLVYLTAQNRPYSANDIFLNLHRDVGKTAVQKALDLLVADGKVREKLNGKQKAYVVSQGDIEADDAAKVAELDEEIRYS
jgi:26S proteasome regulatory subunit (ATPase 3-interacting protein)